MKIGIVMPVISQYEKALKALASVETQHTWTPYIIPNWQLDFSVPSSFNSGIRRAIRERCDYIILSNDDVLYSKYTIDGLVELMENHNIVIANGYDARAEIPPERILSMSHLNPASIRLIEDNGISACSMIRPSFVQDVGWFDENFFPGYFEDNDISYRLRILGHKSLSTTAAPYYHYGSSSQNAFLSEGRPIVDGAAFTANHAYLVAKWGTDDPDNPVYTHPFNDPNNSPKEWKAEWRPR